MTDTTLYVHLADDGGILSIDGGSGRSAWITHAALLQRLAELRGIGGSVLLSREHGSPMSAVVAESLSSAGVGIVQTQEIHPDALRQGGLTALMSAAYVGALVLAEDLVCRGAELEATDRDGFTALMYAVNGEQCDMAKRLISAGADPNRPDRDGSTALMLASQHGNLKIVKALLAAGADPTSHRADGITARQIAVRNGHERTAAILTTFECDRQPT